MIENKVGAHDFADLIHEFEFGVQNKAVPGS